MKVPEWIWRLALRRWLEENMGAILAALSGWKTYIASAITILLAIASLLHLDVPGVPQVEHSVAINMIVTAILAMFLRNGVAKSGPIQ